MTETHASIPDELTARDQWVVWRDDKVPYNARTHRRASSTDPRTWSAFSDALQALSTGKYQGLGFVLSERDPYVGIDLDDCIDAEGYLEDWAAPIVNGLNSYTEVTPSGRGLHIWVKGDVPASCKYISGGERIEIYPNKRYFTITGHRVEGFDPIIRTANGALHTLYARCTTPELPNVAPAAADGIEAYTDAALRGILSDLASAGTGERNDQLNAKAYRLGKFVGHGLIDEATALDALTDAGQALGLPPREVRSTVRSGLRSGIRDYQQLTPPQPRIRATTITPAPPEPLPPDELLTGVVTALDLQRKTFEHIPWPVDDILPIGVVLLVGKPKSYKSWLALQVAVEVARGGVVLGKYDTRQGDTLFLDLESNQRRMQSRLESMLGSREQWPANMRIKDSWRRGAEGIQDLERWMELFPNTKVIVIDILAQIRAPRDKNANVYDEDYGALQPLNAFAEKHRICVIVVHHTRKAKADDPFDMISGSNAISGAVSAMWMLERVSTGKDEAVLRVRGRDILIDEEIGVRWDNEAARHIYEGTAELVTSSAERRAILDAMPTNDPYTLSEIAARVGKSTPNIANMLRVLIADRLVEKVGHGKYARVVRNEHDERTKGNEHNEDR